MSPPQQPHPHSRAQCPATTSRGRTTVPSAAAGRLHEAPRQTLSWPSGGPGLLERICSVCWAPAGPAPPPKSPAWTPVWTWLAPLGKGAGDGPCGQEGAMGPPPRARRPCSLFGGGTVFSTETWSPAISLWLHGLPQGPEVPTEEEKSHTEVIDGVPAEEGAVRLHSLVLSCPLPTVPWAPPGPCSLLWGPHWFLSPALL